MNYFIFFTHKVFFCPFCVPKNQENLFQLYLWELNKYFLKIICCLIIIFQSVFTDSSYNEVVILSYFFHNFHFSNLCNTFKYKLCASVSKHARRSSFTNYITNWIYIHTYACMVTKLYKENQSKICCIFLNPIFLPNFVFKSFRCSHYQKLNE